MRKTASIRTALFFIILLAAAMLTGLVGLNRFAEIAREKTEVASGDLEKLSITLSEIEVSLLQARVSERSYLQSQTDEAVAQFDEKALQINRSITSALQFMGTKPEYAENTGLLESLANSATAYKAGFDEMVKAQRALGYTPDDGLQGELRTAVRSVEKSLESITKHPEMQAKMLMMRRHEKDFLLREDPEYLASLNDRVAEFREFPLTNYLNFAQKNDIDALLTQYQTAFASYVDQAMKVKDMRMELTAEFGVAQPLLDQIKENFAQAKPALQKQMDAAQVQVRNMSIALSVAGIIVFAAATVWISMLIARPLMAIGTALERMRENDFTAPLRPSRIRETAAIAVAFEAFRQDMALRQGINAQISEVIAACASGDFSRRIALQDGMEDPSGLLNGVNGIGEATQKGIDDVLSVIEALSRGDLTQRMASGHKGIFLRIAAAADLLTDNLSQIVADMSHTSERLNQTSGQIVGASHIASQRGQTSAASLEQTAAALEQLSSTVKDTAASAGAAEKFVGGAQARTDDAYRLAGEARAAIKRIRDSSKAIASIVDLIEDIAFQTNLLALNAGVEAARAGSAGLGFAVVASEVRGLAQRVADSAGEINKLVRSSEKHVGDGVDLVAQSSASLAAIRDIVGNVVLRVAEIAQNTEGQSHGITEINIAVSALDRDVQNNVASLDETVAAGEALRSEALRLGQLVGHFKLAAQTGVQPLPLAAE